METTIPKVYRVEFVAGVDLENRLNEINMSHDFSIISMQPTDPGRFVIVCVDLREMYGEPRDPEELAN